MILYSPGDGGTRLFWNSRRIQIQFRYSCGPGYARLRHFLLDANMCRVAGFFLVFLIQHGHRRHPGLDFYHPCLD
jgi:hypothetical protein